MQIAGREVVDVVLLEHAAKEVDGLVERVDSVERVEVGPQCVENLISRARHVGPRQQKAEERQDLPPNGGAGDVAISDPNRHAVLILDIDAVGEASGECPAQCGCAYRPDAAVRANALEAAGYQTDRRSASRRRAAVDAFAKPSRLAPELSRTKRQRPGCIAAADLTDTDGAVRHVVEHVCESGPQRTSGSMAQPRRRRLDRRAKLIDRSPRHALSSSATRRHLLAPCCLAKLVAPLRQVSRRSCRARSDSDVGRSREPSAAWPRIEPPTSLAATSDERRFIASSCRPRRARKRAD